MKLSTYSYFFLRLPIALSMLGHGLVRLPKLSVFANGLAAKMSASWIPHELILGFNYLVPFVEFITGLLLLLGLFTRPALYAMLTLMAIFIFGNTTIENFDGLTPLLIHAGYMAMLVILADQNPAPSTRAAS